MTTADFCKDFNSSIDAGDVNGATYSLMKELGRILVRHKQDFVDLLNESGISASINDNDAVLVNHFVENVSTNPKLVLGASLLTQMHNKQMGFDGTSEISDDGVKNGYYAMQSYFDADEYSYVDTGGIGASTLKGGATGGTAGLVVGAIGDIAKATSKISEGSQKRKYGGIDYLSKKQDAKTAMVQAALAQRQAQIDATNKTQERNAKTKRLTYIIGGSVLGVAIIATVIILLVKKKKQ